MADDWRTQVRDDGGGIPRLYSDLVLSAFAGDVKGLWVPALLVMHYITLVMLRRPWTGGRSLTQQIST